MNPPANTWICLLLIVSSASGIHGKDDSKSAEYYEDYEDGPSQNSTSYKLNVPDSFQSYLEHLLTKGNSTGEEEAGKKGTNSTQLSGTEQANDVSKKKQDSSLTSLSSLNNNSNNMDKTVQALVNSLQTPKGPNNNRPTIYHPYRRTHISHLLNKLGKGTNVSSLENHNHKQSSSHEKMNENYLNDVNAQKHYQGTVSKESTNISDSFGENKLLNHERLNQKQSNSEHFTNSEEVLKLKESGEQTVLNSNTNNNLEESFDKVDLHADQQNYTTDYLNTKHAEAQTSVTGVNRAVSSLALTQNHTQNGHDKLGVSTYHSNTFQPSTVGNSHAETVDISEDRDTDGDEGNHASNKQDLKKVTKNGSEANIHKIITTEPPVDNVSSTINGKQESFAHNGDNLSHTHKVYGNNEARLVTKKEISSLKSDDKLLLPSYPTTKLNINQNTSDKVNVPISKMTSSPVQSGGVQSSTEVISNNNTKITDVVSQPAEMGRSTSSESTLLDEVPSRTTVNVQPLTTMLAEKNKLNQLHDGISREILLNSSFEKDSGTNQLIHMNRTNRLESDEITSSSSHVHSSLTNGTAENGRGIDNTLSKGGLTSTNITKKHPIADLLDSLVKITTPNKISVRKRKNSSKSNKTIDSQSTSEEFEENDDQKAAQDLLNTRFNNSDRVESLGGNPLSRVRVIPKLSSLNQMENEDGSAKQSLTKLESYSNNNNILINKSKSEAAAVSAEEKVNKGFKYNDLHSKTGVESKQNLRSYSDSKNFLENSQVESKEQLMAALQAEKSYGLSDKKQQDFTKSYVGDVQPAVQETSTEPRTSEINGSAGNEEKVNEAFGKHNTVKQSSQLHKIESKNLEEDSNAKYSDSTIKYGDDVKNQRNLYSGTNIKHDLNMSNGAENLNVIDFANRKHNALILRNITLRKENNSGSDSITSNGTDRHAIEDLLASLVKITSSNKSIKRRKKKRKGKKSLLTNKQVDTENQLQIDTDQTNENSMDITSVNNPKTINEIQSFNGSFTRTDFNSSMIDDSLKQPLSSYVSKYYLRKENLASNEANNLLKTLQAKKQQDAVQLAVTNVEQANKENSIGPTNHAVKLLNEENSKNIQSFISKHGYNTKRVSNLTRDGSDQKFTKNITYIYNNNADQTAVTSGNQDSIHSNSNTSQEHKQTNHIGLGLTVAGKEDILTSNSKASMETASSNVETNEIKKSQTHNSNQLVIGNGSQTYFEQKSQVPKQFNTLASNAMATETEHHKVESTNGKGLEGVIYDIYNILNSYIGNTSRTNQVGGNTIHSQKLESYTTIKERILTFLSKLNDLIHTTKQSLLSEGNITKQLQNVTTNDQQLSDEKLAQLFAIKALQKQEGKTISDIGTHTTEEQYYNTNLNLSEKVNMPVQYPKVFHNDSKQNNNSIEKSLNKIRARHSQVDRSEKRLSTQSTRLNEFQGKTTSDELTNVQMKPISNGALIGFNNDKKSSFTNNNLITRQYESQGHNIKQQEATLQQGLKVQEEDFKKLINKLKHDLNVSDTVHSSKNDKKEQITDHRQDYGSTLSKSSNNEILKINPQIISSLDDNNKRYLEKNTLNVNSNSLELSKQEKVEENVRISNEGVKELSGSQNTMSLNSNNTKLHLNDFKQVQQESSQFNSNNFTKALTQHSNENRDYASNIALTKEVNHIEKGVSSVEAGHVKVDETLKGKEKSKAFVGRRSTDPLLKLKKLKKNDLKNDLELNTNTNIQTQQSVNSSGTLDSKQKLFIPIPMTSMDKNSNKNEYQNSIAQEKSEKSVLLGNYSSSEHIGQDLDENSRLHIIITPLDKKPNITVEIGVENKNNSTRTNPAILQSKKTFNWGGSKIVGVNKIESKNSDDSNRWYGSGRQIKLRSLPHMFILKRKVNETDSHNNSNALPTNSLVTDKAVDKIKSSNSNAGLIDSKPKVLKSSRKHDRGATSDVSVDVKDGSKVTNRKRVTKKEEVVEVNEKMKANIVLGKSKTVQTIKTEVSSVDYL